MPLHIAQIAEHARTAANQHAIVFRVQLRQADGSAHNAIGDQVGQTALIAERPRG